MKKRTLTSLAITLGVFAWLQTETTSGTTPTNTEPLSEVNVHKSHQRSSSFPLHSDSAHSASTSELALDVAEDITPAAESTPLAEFSALPSEALTHYHIDSDTQTHTITAKPNELVAADDNSKPVLNQDAYLRIEREISSWELIEGKPTKLSLWAADLFDDPEHDFLSKRIELTLSGVKLAGTSTLELKGIPAATIAPTLTISARDDHHGVEEDAWVSVHFDLPLISPSQLFRHPLEGETVYRLETTSNLAGQSTPYEVVYCEAFKFIDQNVYYASSTNKTQCPNEDRLQKLGNYVVDGVDLIVSSRRSSFDAEQTWTLKKQYASIKHPEVENYFVSVYDGKQFESYTMQKSRSAMEQRINAPTGRYLYQIAFFDYLLPLQNGEYLVSEIGNFIYNHNTEVVGPFGEIIDSDLNLRTYQQSLSCVDVAFWYNSHVIAGQGDYQIEIITSPYPYDPTYNIDCYEYTSNLTTGQISLAFDLNYSPYDELLAGEVYSYILRPKPEFADRVEEIKLNLIYSHPN